MTSVLQQTAAPQGCRTARMIRQRLLQLGVSGSGR
jgi:hypothetical protein